MRSLGLLALDRRSRFAAWVLTSAAAVPLVLSGCAGSSTMTGSQPSSGPTMTGETSVVVLGTSTANDQLAQFNIAFTGIQLTSQSGKTVTLLSSPVTAEFIHLNGGAEPLATVNVPDDTYTSATATLGSAWFTCTGFNAGAGLENNTFEDGQVPASSITVQLPQPITVSGTGMAIELNLMVSQSASFSSCQNTPDTTFSITPTFTIASMPVAANPTNTMNGMATGLHGLITAVSQSESILTVAGGDGPNGPSWQVGADSRTVFQGISKFSKLAKGMPVNLDVAIQPDGSLLATRIAVYDTSTSNLNVFTGPIDSVIASPPAFSIIGQEQQGYLDQSSYYLGAYEINFSNAAFAVSSPLTNLQSLPFTPILNAAGLVAGQNLSVTSHVSSFPSGSLPVATVALTPQTINGAVSDISSEGSFTTYTVTLAPYDLFPNLALQPSQSNLLASPDTIVVYADNNTQKLNQTPLSVGSVFRFNGLVFDDHGTLRMDCAQVLDGVPE
ncbi:MAG TPA: hypothetical protein VKR52_06160 [Terracidiphilus sp.]|nr:hypothetical protein [Terracidiphilus sp.]